MKTLRQILLFQLASALFWVHTAEAQTDITNSAGNITAQYSDSPTGEEIGKVIDNQPTSKYLTFHNAAWIQFQSTSPAIVTRYAITSANDWDERDPKNWTLKASTNGTTWVTLNTQTNQDFTSRAQKKEYSFSNATAYNYYRLEIQNNGDTSLQLAEWELLSTSASVTVFQHINYAGTRVALPVGSYTTAQLQARGIPNDWISSVRVANGYTITFYDNDNFQGPSLTKTADDATLVNDGWNDRATSLTVAAATTPAPAAPTELVATAVSTSEISLSWKDNASTETLFRIERSTDGTTYTSLATVGANVTSYANTGLTAATQYSYRVRAENSGGASAYSNVSSATTGTNPSGGNVATVYADCAFTTNGVALPVGTYTSAQLRARGISDASISSVRVTNGYQVVLYEDDNFAGPSVVISTSNSCLTDNGFDFNDRTSSVRVQVYDPNTSVPIEPSYARALGVNGTSAQVTWVDNSSNETAFRIERSTSTSNFVSVGTVGANTTSYTSTGLTAGTKYYFRVRAENTVGNSRYSNLCGANAKETPPATFSADYVADHAQYTMTLITYNDDVAFYGDPAFLANNRAQVDAWIDSFITENWKYVKASYGSFGANRLYCFMHGFNSGGTIASMFDSNSRGRNTIDVGASDWSATDHRLREVLTHEIGHIIEGSSNNVHESPSFPIWGDSKWCEIEVYDVFYKTGVADAQQSYDGFTKQTKDGVYWFRDWFYPLWRDYGQTAFLSRYFELLARHFPKQLENETNFIYSKRANEGEFFYFMSAAAGVSLKAKATAVFGWNAAKEAEWQQAKLDYPDIKFAESAAQSSGLSASAAATTPNPASFQVFPNPNQGEATLGLEANKAQQTTVYVHDAQGYLVSLLTVPVQAGHNNFKLPTRLPRGTYHLRTRLDGQDQRFTLRVE